MENAPGFCKIEHSLVGFFTTQKTVLMTQKPYIQFKGGSFSDFSSALNIQIEVDHSFDEKTLIHTQIVKVYIPLPELDFLYETLNRFRIFGGILILTDKLNQKWVYGCENFPLYLTSQINIKLSRECECVFTSKSDTEPLQLKCN